LCRSVLNELLSLDVAHTVDTGDTISVKPKSQPPSILFPCLFLFSIIVPNGKNTTSLGERSLLLNTTDALLEDGRNLSWRGLVGIAAGGLDGDWGDAVL